jgi:transcriptional regulator with XRE-family HTH domain
MTPSRPSFAWTVQMQISAIDVLVGRRLRVLRISRGLEPEAFAAALNIAPARLHCYENGEERIPPRVLNSMADLLQLPMQAFFDPNHARLVHDDPAPRPQSETSHDDSEATELLQYFSKIKDRALRTEVLNFVAFLSQYP